MNFRTHISILDFFISSFSIVLASDFTGSIVSVLDKKASAMLMTAAYRFGHSVKLGKSRVAKLQGMCEDHCIRE